MAKSEAQMEAQIAQQEKTLRQQLDEMPKVKLTVPQDPSNPDALQIVAWNGIVYSIPRGITFEVPQVIADIWQESYSKTMAINKRISESVNKEIVVM